MGPYPAEQLGAPPIPRESPGCLITSPAPHFLPSPLLLPPRSLGGSIEDPREVSGSGLVNCYCSEVYAVPLLMLVLVFGAKLDSTSTPPHPVLCSSVQEQGSPGGRWAAGSWAVSDSECQRVPG